MRISSTTFIIGLLVTQITNAEIIGVAGGTAAPAPTLGPYAMTAFPPDDRPLIQPVSSIPSPLGGDVDFSDPTLHVRIGEGWAVWSHGYSGDVYSTIDFLNEITLTLPPDTYAFYFYGAHDHGSLQTLTAQVEGGPSITQIFFASDASYYGFYQDDPSEGPLETITISSPINFAIGEFGIAVPEPGMATLLAIGMMTLMRRRH